MWDPAPQPPFHLLALVICLVMNLCTLLCVPFVAFLRPAAHVFVSNSHVLGTTSTSLFLTGRSTLNNSTSPAPPLGLSYSILITFRYSVILQRYHVASQASEFQLRVVHTSETTVGPGCCRCGLWSSCINITWELVSNAESQVLRNPILPFKKVPRWLVSTLEFEQPCCRPSQCNRKNAFWPLDGGRHCAGITGWVCLGWCVPPAPPW